MQRAIAAYRRGDWADAERLCRSLLNAKADNFDALHLLGVIAGQTRRTEEAVELLTKAVSINPTNAVAHNNRGNALRDIERFDEALESYNRALGIKPDYAEAYSNRGIVLRIRKRFDEALESYDRAIELRPTYAEAHNNRGNALRDLKRDEDALESYDHALRIRPNYAEAFNNRGNALQELKRHEEALESYARALKIKPDYADACNNRGNALRDLKRFEEAIENYERVLKIEPDYAFLFGAWLNAKMRICDWKNLRNDISALVDKISSGEKASPSFSVLALSSSLPLQKQAALTWVQDKCPASHALPKIAKWSEHGRIRIGYFSADYHDHAVAYLIAELFETHDRAKFEPIGFSLGPIKNDKTRERIARAFDRFIEVGTKSDKDVALLSRSLELDIAVDLNGFTEDGRPGIFASRAAPVQVSYLGYPGTMGADYIDYLIADPTLIPESARQYYSEKIVYLPNSYQANDTKRRISDKAFTRDQLGLPKTGFVFCCFNSNYKITPGTFDGWARILKQVEGSVLWLFEDNATATGNLRQEAVRRGVDAERLIFATRMPLAEHLARHRMADLFVDTLPYNAHTTASDALWAGLPVLTRVDEAFASRVSASLLNAIGLPELIASTQAEYEALAIELAANPDRLKRIRQKLENNRLTMPLFDTKLFTKHMEDAYMKMYERYRADLPPDHIHVPS